MLHWGKKPRQLFLLLLLLHFAIDSLFGVVTVTEALEDETRYVRQQPSSHSLPLKKHQFQLAKEAKAARSRLILTQQQILAQLFSSTSDYNPLVRPPVREQAHHSAILVITSVYIDRINWDDSSAAFIYTIVFTKPNFWVVDLYLRQQWLDSRLHYDIDSREGVQEVLVPRGREIWHPDTFFIGAEEMAPGEELRTRAVVEPSGFVRFSEKRSLTLSVESTSAYPLVSRRFLTLKLSSYNYPVEDVVYVWANSPPHVLPVEVSEELLHPSSPHSYAFLDAEAGDCLGNYTAGTYSCISVRLQFSGCAVMEWIKWLLPSVLLIMASWLHFWIPGSWSVPRTVSAAVPFFIFAALLLFHTGSKSSALVIWLAACTLLSFASLVEYILVIYAGGSAHRVRYTNGGILRSGTTPTEPYSHSTHSPHYTQQEGATAYSTQAPHHPPPSTSLESSQQHEGTRSLTTHARPNANSIDATSKWLFPIVSIVFLMVFFVYYLVF